MKNKMIAAVACLGAAIGCAQTMETSVRVNLPVDAKVGNVSLPAGGYSIREVKNSVLEISSDSRKGASAFVIVNPVETANHEAADHTKLVLRKNENGYQLQSIWLEGQEMGFEVAE
jgi:hypothetical protein